MADEEHIETFSKLRIVDRAWGSDQVRQAVSGRRVLTLSQLAALGPSGLESDGGAARRALLGSRGDVQREGATWTTIAVVASKSPPSVSRAGGRFSHWKLTDYKTELTMFVFDELYTESTGIAEGSIVIVSSPVVLPASDSKSFAISVSRRGQLARLGRSPVFGHCRANRKDGTRCTVAVDTGMVGYCTFHFKDAFAASSALQASLTGTVRLKQQDTHRNVSAGTYTGSVLAYVASGAADTVDPRAASRLLGGRGGGAVPSAHATGALVVNASGSARIIDTGAARTRGIKVSDDAARSALDHAVQGAAALAGSASGRGLRFATAAIAPGSTVGGAAAAAARPPSPPGRSAKRPRSEAVAAGAGAKQTGPVDSLVLARRSDLSSRAASEGSPLSRAVLGTRAVALPSKTAVIQNTATSGIENTEAARFRPPAFGATSAHSRPTFVAEANADVLGQLFGGGADGAAAGFAACTELNEDAELDALFEMYEATQASVAAAAAAAGKSPPPPPQRQ